MNSLVLHLDKECESPPLGSRHASRERRSLWERRVYSSQYNYMFFIRGQHNTTLTSVTTPLSRVVLTLPVLPSLHNTTLTSATTPSSKVVLTLSVPDKYD